MDNQDKEFKDLFLKEAEQLLESADLESAEELTRLAHTLKGNSAMVGFTEINELCEALERCPTPSPELVNAWKEQLLLMIRALKVDPQAKLRNDLLLRRLRKG